MDFGQPKVEAQPFKNMFGSKGCEKVGFGVPESENGETDGVRFSEPVFLARSTGKSRIWKAAYRSLKTLETARKPEREAEGEEEGGSENGGKMM